MSNIEYQSIGKVNATIDKETLSLDIEDIVRKNTSINNINASCYINTSLLLQANLKTEDEELINDSVNLYIRKDSVKSEFYFLGTTLLDNKKDNNINFEIPWERLVSLLDVTIGKYTLLLEYMGNRYYLPTSSLIELYIKKQTIIPIIDNIELNGKLNEEVYIKLQLVNNRQEIITNDNFIFKIDNNIKDYFTDTSGFYYISYIINNNKDIDFNILLSSSDKYDNLNFHTTLNINIEKITTHIKNTIKIDNNIILKSILTDENGVLISQGNVTGIYYHNDNIVKIAKQKVQNGTTSLLFPISSLDIVNNNTIDLYNISTPVETTINIEYPSTLHTNTLEEFKVQIINKNTKSVITDGIIVFFEDGIQKYFTEIDDDGYGYVYIKENNKGEHSIQAKYYGFFEYLDSLSDEIELFFE